MTYTREYFERQAAELQQQNAMRRATRRPIRDERKRYRGMPDTTKLSALTRDEVEYIKRLKDTHSVNEIAGLLAVDLVTVAAVIEGVA